MIKRLYKRFLLWVLSPAINEIRGEMSVLEVRSQSEVAVLQSQIEDLRCR